jgi:hypothetical protein
MTRLFYVKDDNFSGIVTLQENYKQFKICSGDVMFICLTLTDHGQDSKIVVTHKRNIKEISEQSHPECFL